MPVRRKICTIEEFTEIKLRLADFFDRLAAGTADDDLAVEPDGSKCGLGTMKIPVLGGA